MINILIVDDELQVIDNIKRAFERSSQYNFYYANGYNEAMSILSNACIDILIVDYLLGPPYNGDELIFKLKSDQEHLGKYQNMPIILMTGSKGLNAMKLTMVSLGVDYHLKESSWYELVDKVDKYALNIINSIDIGVVIALDEEFKNLFPRINASSEYDEVTNGYYYKFNVITEQYNRRRLVCAFVDDMGPTKAALLADRLMHKYVPTVIINIGIAGSMDSEVLVGDVIFATQVDSYLENSKAVNSKNDSNYQFELSGDPYKTTPKYYTHAKNIKYTNANMYTSWASKCISELNSIIESTALDKLFSDNIIRSAPFIETGRVASGPIVGSSTNFVKWLKSKRDRKYLALEMESVGVVTAAYGRSVDSIVIRGISDYCDKRKRNLDRLFSGALRKYAMNNALDYMLLLLNKGLI